MQLRSNWKCYNLTLTNAGQTYSQILTSAVKYIMFRCRPRSSNVPSGNIRYSLIEDEIDTKFVTLPYPLHWESKGDMVGTKTIYFQCDVAGVIVEIEEWS